MEASISSRSRIVGSSRRLPRGRPENVPDLSSLVLSRRGHIHHRQSRRLLLRRRYSSGFRSSGGSGPSHLRRRRRSGVEPQLVAAARLRRRRIILQSLLSSTFGSRGSGGSGVHESIGRRQQRRHLASILQATFRSDVDADVARIVKNEKQQTI